MKIFPESALNQMEFDKIKQMLLEKCRTEYAKTKASELRIHTRKDFIDRELRQSYEFKQLLQNGAYFPNDYILNLEKELRLLQIENAMLNGEQFLDLRKLAESIENIFRWFDAERLVAFYGLAEVIKNTHYEKKIIALIDAVIDESGQVKDNASTDLAAIRMNLYRKRNELRRVFDRIVQKLNKQGYLAEIEESFMNGRRVLAVFAEQKRTVKGILHGESESRRTTFIEPEETILLNNEVHEFEIAEKKEVYRLLKELTFNLGQFAPLLIVYHTITGEYDFIRAKAAFAISIRGEYPVVTDKAHVQLQQAYHPLLLVYNQRSGKPIVPVDILLNEKGRILVISGPNAGGKTVTMKTVGLLQLMVQSGLLVPVHPASQFGIFKQLLIHIGDTQNLEFELSTYSSHLLSMKHFMETANGKTLFFIDELGSGSDPNLGGAFAEVIMEELARKHAFGIVTTHYLNLKVMANKTSGILNGAMAFDEKNLLPLYQLAIGKPGSSYTFAIAQRIGLEKRLIDKARAMVDEDHFTLDKLLNTTEQDLQKVQEKEKQLHRLLKENERLKKEMEQVLNKERHLQQVELLRHQNKLTDEKLQNLKDMERNMRALVLEWKKAEDKNKVIKEISALLFKKNDTKAASKKQKLIDTRYTEVIGEINIGARVKTKKNMQIGQVLELRGKKAVVKIGLLPMQIDLADLVLIREKDEEEKIN